MLSGAALHERRERTFVVLAGIFLCAMTLLNVIGITRFVQLGPLALAVGVLPYPLTFLCTDLICELYGKARANFLVTVGLGLNFFILGVLLLGNSIPSVPAEHMPPLVYLTCHAFFLLFPTMVVGAVGVNFRALLSNQGYARPLQLWPPPANPVTCRP